jgi:integrase
MPLSDAALRRAPAGAIVREEGLEFRFFEAGKAGVRYVGRIKGSAKRFALGLGTYPALTLSEARRRRDEAKTAAAIGDDPRHVRRDKAEAHGRTVGTTLPDYLTFAKRENRPSTARDKKNMLNLALKTILHQPLNKIGKGDVAKVLDRYAEKPAARRLVFSYLSHFLAWAEERDLITANPCRHVRAPRQALAKDRVLTAEEIAALWAAEGEWPDMVRLMLLTAARGGNVCQMRRQDIDLEAAQWIIPAEHFKQGRRHTVPLSASALSIISSAIDRRSSDWGPFIFGLGSKGQKPFNGRSKAMALLLKMTGTKAWSAHDARRTAVTVMQRHGVYKEIRDSLTGHAKPRTGAAPYERYDYEHEGRKSVEILARALTTPESPLQHE